MVHDSHTIYMERPFEKVSKECSPKYWGQSKSNAINYFPPYYFIIASSFRIPGSWS